jgi:hypothetical protein
MDVNVVEVKEMQNNNSTTAKHSSRWHVTTERDPSKFPIFINKDRRAYLQPKRQSGSQSRH